MIKDKPLDIQPGDKISFTPNGIGDNGRSLYQVAFSQGNALETVDGTHSIVPITTDDGSAAITDFTPGFPFLGTNFGDSTNFQIRVAANGNIVLGIRTANTWAALSTNIEENLIGGGVYRIAPYYSNLSPQLLPSVVTRKATSDGRLIITWTNIVKQYFPTGSINTANTYVNSTFQVILYGNGNTVGVTPGTIEFVYGQLDNHSNDPLSVIATIGIAKGDAWANYPVVPVGSKMGKEVDFTKLTTPVTLPVDAIYETFTQGYGIDGDDHDDDD